VLLGDGLDCAGVAVDGCLQAPVAVAEFLDVLGGSEFVLQVDDGMNEWQNGRSTWSIRSRSSTVCT
jgi:hypothetical protein